MAKATAKRQPHNAAADSKQDVSTVRETMRRWMTPMSHFFRSYGIDERNGSVGAACDDVYRAEAKAVWEIVKRCDGDKALLSASVADVASRTGETVADVLELGVIEFAKALASKPKPAGPKTAAEIIAELVPPLTDNGAAVFAKIHDHGPKTGKELVNLGLPDQSTLTKTIIPELKKRKLVANRKGAGYFSLVKNGLTQ
jgi:hypothetical protein